MDESRWSFFDGSPYIVEALSSVGFNARVCLLKDLPENWKFLVTPGNSFGLMDGGFDQAVVDLFGPSIQNSVRTEIDRWHGGYLPVGQNVVAPLPGNRFLIYAPTMESPRSIRHTLNVFWALRSAILRVKLNPHVIGNVVCPGFGTLTGGLTPAAAAMQMFLAFEASAIKPKDWASAMRLLAHLERARSIP